MNPQLVRRVGKAIGPLFNPLSILYLLIADHSSWRFFPAWFLSFRKEHSSLSDGMPWLPFQAMHWLQSYLQRDMKVFEYGSGGSTVFFAQRVGQVYSVEHDKAWYTLVTKNLAQRGLTNCSYMLHAPQSIAEVSSTTGTPEYACLMFDEWEEYQGFSFDAYVRVIDIYPNHNFDLILVDGRARAACMARAISKVRRGGYLMLDNSNEEHIIGGLDIMQPYPRTDFHSIAPYWPPLRWQTSVWRL